MASGQLGMMIGRLQREAAAGADPDAELLGRFVERADGDAFAAIVRRHGPVVLAVCRRLTGDHHDAEDSFQATFLVLARRAAAVSPRDRLANWLYGVAFQVGRKARAARARRLAREVTSVPEPASAPPAVSGDDLRAVIEEEVARLPEKYRTPVVLCDLGGKTHAAAGALLGWPAGTISGRLARGRALLARRLVRRGLAPAAGGTAAACSAGTAAAAVPGPLAAATVRAACLYATGRPAAGVVPATAAALTDGVVTTMVQNKVKLLAAVLLALGAGAAAVGYAGPKAGGAADPPPVAPVGYALVGPPAAGAGGKAAPAARPEYTVECRIAEVKDGKEVKSPPPAPPARDIGGGPARPQLPPFPVVCPKARVDADARAFFSCGGSVKGPDGVMVPIGHSVTTVVHPLAAGRLRVTVEFQKGAVRECGVGGDDLTVATTIVRTVRTVGPGETTTVDLAGDAAAGVTHRLELKVTAAKE